MAEMRLELIWNSKAIKRLSIYVAHKMSVKSMGVLVGTSGTSADVSGVDLKKESVSV